jgi:hypothetical protein
MGKVGSIHEWYRFLDARSDDEATMLLMTHVARLDRVYGDLKYTVSRLSYTPGGEVSANLSLAATALADAMGELEAVAARFRAGERGIA